MIEQNYLSTLGKYALCAALSFGGGSVRVGCEYDEPLARDKEEKTIERLEDYNAVLVRLNSQPYLVLAIDERGDLKARDIRGVNRPFEFVETRKYDSRGIERGIERVLKITGKEMNVVEDVYGEVSSVSVKRR
ncbi:MAG: hypothetical protein AABW58_00800 [Nanoarchaeota archaeon]